MPDFRVGADDSLPLDADRAWSPGEATDRIFAWAGWNGTSAPDHGGGSARKGFLLYDAEHPDLRSSYVCPFADEVEGQLRAIPDGVSAAEIDLPEAEGVGADARQQARKVLDVYLSRMDAGTPDDEPAVTRSASPIALLPISLGRGLIQAGSDISTLPDGLLAQIQDRTVLQETSLYLFDPVASTDHEDYYGTIMRPSSLRNYAEDAQAGLPFCNSHDADVLGFGRVYDGKYKANRGHGPASTTMSVYVPADLNVNGVDTTHLVRGIRTGVVRDVSITFDPEAIFCSIDSKRFPLTLAELFGALDNEDAAKRYCLEHYPKADYVIEGRKVHCTGGVEGAHTIELSSVYRGATPGARIPNIGVGSRAIQVEGAMAIMGLRSPGLRQAAWMAEAGRLDRGTATMLEERTRGVRFPSTTDRRYAGVTPARTDRTITPPPPTEAQRMPIERETPATGTPSTEDAVAAAAVGVADGDEAAVAAAQSTAGAEDRPAAAASTAPTASDDRSTDPLHGIRSVLTERGLVPAGWQGDPQSRIMELCADLSAANSRMMVLDAELHTLRPLAETGRQARAELVVQCRASGVRAFGNDFPETVYGPVFENGSYAQLLETQRHFEAESVKRGLVPGRVTQDVPEGTRDSSGTTGVPARTNQRPAAVQPARSRASFRSR